MRKALATLLALSVVLFFPGPVGFSQQARNTESGTPVAAEPAAQKSPLQGVDAFIEEQMKVWKVPGLALAVVRDGQVIHMKGYGDRDREKKLPVTPQTLFAIGSITKSFTVTALGMLVDEGKVDWDKPVRDYLPAFKLHDPVASERMTPRDLVTHRSGLPRHDFLWYNASFTRAEMVERLRHLEPSEDFRSTFQYNNLMFMTAGYLVGQLSGMKWEEFVRQRIFEPLEMTSSNFSVRTSQQSDDFAQPYKKAEEKIELVPFRVIDQVGPAGSINSNVEDMSHYLLFHLAQGKYNEQQVLSENNARQMQTPQMSIAGVPQYEELGHSSYGLGLSITSYRGQKVVQHGGGIDGFISLFSFMPRKKIGMIILTNLSGGNPLPTVVSRQVYDRLLGLEPVDWSGRFQKQRKQGEESEEEAQEKGYTGRKEGTKMSHALSDYAGEFEHPGYGIVRIEQEGEGLKLIFKNMTSPLEHFHYDVFAVPENPLDPFEKMKVMFRMNVSGEIAEVLLPLEPNVGEIVFTRRAAEEMRTRAFLEPLTGEYAIGETTLKVTLKGEETLILSVAGQPPYELVPRQGLTFDLKGLTGYSVEFKKDASGNVVELAFYQPQGTFVAKRK